MSRFINMDARIINILLATVETSSETIFMTKPTKLSHFVFQEILKHKPEQADLAIYSYSTAHFKLDDTRVQQLHGSTRFQKRTQHFPRAHDRPMTYYHWKLHACMHETFVLLACVA